MRPMMKIVAVSVVLVMMCTPSMGDDGVTRIPIPLPWIPWTPVIPINDSIVANFTDTTDTKLVPKEVVAEYDIIGLTTDYIASFLKPVAALMVMGGGIMYATSQSDASRGHAIQWFKNSIGAIMLVLVLAWFIYVWLV